MILSVCLPSEGDSSSGEAEEEADSNSEEASLSWEEMRRELIPISRRLH